MPALPRKDKMDPAQVEIHFTWSRCVSRAWLFGVDPLTRQDHSHRLEWLESLVEFLSSVFAVDVGGYHFLSNHMHNILRSRPDIAATLSDEDVVWRWKRAWPQRIGGRWKRDPTDDELNAMLQRGREQPDYIPQLRLNLSNISWWQARFKETIAKLSNREVDHAGHFWEARYGNRKLETEGDVVTAFLYNDLQQVRAGIVDSVEASDYSSIQRQIRARAQQAFEDVHGREPHARADGEELEHLEALFANCFLSPIASDGPLITSPEPSPPPPTELVLPWGYLFERNADNTTSPTASNDQEEAEEDAGEAVESDESASGPRPRPRGRPRRRRSRTIHRRLRERLRRRASRNSILTMPWDQYHELLQRVAQQELEKRRDPVVPPPDESPPRPPGAAPDSCSPSNWRQHFRQFTRSLQGLATRLPSQLAAWLLSHPRGDPDDSAEPAPCE